MRPWDYPNSEKFIGEAKHLLVYFRFIHYSQEAARVFQAMLCDQLGEVVVAPSCREAIAAAATFDRWDSMPTNFPVFFSARAFNIWWRRLKSIMSIQSYIVLIDKLDEDGVYWGRGISLDRQITKMEVWLSGFAWGAVTPLPGFESTQEGNKPVIRLALSYLNGHVEE